MWAFSETIDGMAEACRALGTPVTGGNVSFYNETEGEGVYPTPVIGMLGLIEDARHTTTQWFKEAGDVILLLGVTRNDLGASELLSVIAGEASGAVPLAESCFSSYGRNAVGARIDLSEHARLSSVDDVLTLLFAESPSRIIFSVKPEDAAAVSAIADQFGAACSTIGETGGPNLSFTHSGKTLFEVEVSKLEEDWRDALPSHLDRLA